LACNSCGSSKSKFEIYLTVDGREFYVGPRPLYTFLRSIAHLFEENIEYEFIHENKQTGGKMNGKLHFLNKIPYINNRRLI